MLDISYIIFVRKFPTLLLGRNGQLKVTKIPNFKT